MEQAREATATPAGEAVPTTVITARGPVEYAVFAEGPAVIALHGAMGGYDQGLILARTIGPPGYRYVAVSRPGYLGTPLTGGRSSEEQADLCAIEGGEHVAIFTHRDEVRRRVAEFLTRHAPPGART